MSNFTALKTAIQNAIKQNGNEEITGNLLQNILLSIVETLGDSAINTLETNLSNEATTRGDADTQLNNLITGVKNNVDNGYVYAGIATPSTTPVSGKVFYIALQAGTYTNLGGQVVFEGITILKYNGSAWSKEQVLYTDGGVFDISAYNATGGELAKYADLTAALGTNGANIPQSVRKGGMSVKFVQSSDNKYVQYRLMADDWSTTESDWQGVDDEPTAGSDNLVKSGGVFDSDLKAEGFAETSYSWSTGEHSSRNNQVTVNIQSGCEFLIDLVNIGACGVFAYRSDGTYTELGKCVGSAKFTAPHDIAKIGIYHGNVSATETTVGFKVIYNEAALYVLDGISQDKEKILDMPIAGNDNLVKGSGISKFLMTNYVLGKGTTLSATPIVGLIPSHRYRVWLKQLTWNVPSMSYTGATAFGILYYPVGSTSPTVLNAIYTENVATNTKKYIEFVCPSSYDKIEIAGRAVQDENIWFCIEGMTNDESLVNKVSFVGTNNDTLSQSKLEMTFKAGVSYKLHIQCDEMTYMGTAAQEAMLQIRIYGYESGQSIALLDVIKGDDGKSLDYTVEVTPSFDGYLSKADRLSSSNIVNLYRYMVPSLESKDIESVFSIRTLEQREKVSQLGYVRRFWYTEPIGDMTPPDWIPTLTMLHISDTHVGNETTDAQLAHAVELLNTHGINGKNNGDNIKCLLHTGDVRNSNFNDTAGWEKFTAAIAKANRPVFVVAGNHDVGNGYNVAESGTDTQIYTQMVAPLLSSWNLVTESPNTGTPNPTGKCYYFKDFIEEKIRMICLYEYETDFELDPSDNTKLKYQRGVRAFSQEQIDWLIDSLLRTPANYGVMIVKHQQENYQGNTDCAFNSLVFRGQNLVATFCGHNLIADIVHAFMNKTTINMQVSQTGGIVTTLNISADFSNLASGVEFIAYISGHNHQDRVSFLRDYQNQLELNIGCDNTWYTTGSDLWQRQNKLSEDLINCYSINRNAGTITIVRVGADFAYTGQVRQVATLQYR